MPLLWEPNKGCYSLFTWAQMWLIALRVHRFEVRMLWSKLDCCCINSPWPSFVGPVRHHSTSYLHRMVKGEVSRTIKFGCRPRALNWPGIEIGRPKTHRIRCDIGGPSKRRRIG